jgi:large subunit ribosomal protein L35
MRQQAPHPEGKTAIRRSGHQRIAHGGRDIPAADQWLGANKAANSLQTPHEHNEKEHSMPKMKTKSGAKKRFRVRPGGTVKRGQAFKRHILTKKTTKNKRHLRGAVAVHETNMGHMAQMLPKAGL